MHLLALRRLALPLAAFGLVAAGCGGDPPAPPPFTPSTAASSPTPTGPVEPVLPEAAKQPTAEGAKAFAEFYWEQAVNYAQATGDTGPVRAAAASTCVPCDGGADAIEDIYGRDGRITGGNPEVLSSRAARIVDAVPRFRVTLSLKNTAQRIDFPGTKRDSTLGGATQTVDMRLDFLKGSWVVAGWRVL